MHCPALRIRQVFAYIAKAKEVAVIDTATKAIIAHWKLTKAAGNGPMALASGRLFSKRCRRGPIQLPSSDSRESAGLAAKEHRLD